MQNHLDAMALRYFYEVAKAGGFTFAARALRISQPSLSKAVGMLEAQVGVKLLDRAKTGARLTEVGKRVYLKCQEIFEGIEEVQKICTNTVEECGGVFRFGVTDHIANYLLAKKLSTMAEAFPTLQPSVTVGTPRDLLRGILQLDIEFGIMFTRIPDPALEYHPLSQYPLAIVCHPHLLRTRKTKKGPNLLNYIGSVRRAFDRYPVQEIVDSIPIKVGPRFEADSQELQRQLCLEGQGVAILARFMVEADLKARRLVEIPNPDSTPMTLFLVKRRGVNLSVNARTLLEYFNPNPSPKDHSR